MSHTTGTPRETSRAWSTRDRSTPGKNNRRSAPTIRQSLEEYGRGVAGGLLFSLPLLFTMEMWWAGFVAHPARLLVFVLATFVLLLVYNRYAGLHEDSSFLEILIDSVEEMGIGLVISTFILWLLHRIHFEMPPGEMLGKIIIEAMTVAIGVSVGTAQLGADSGDSSREQNDEKDDDATQAPEFLEQIAMSMCGAILIAANIGPTEEIVMLAVEAPPAKLLVTALFSLALCVMILHYSGFRGTHRLGDRESFLEIACGSITTYAVALVASALLCWFFGRFDGASFEIIIAQTVTLAFPATLGASAGRLLLQASAK